LHEASGASVPPDAAEIIGFAWTQLQPFGAAMVDRLLRPFVYEAITDGN